MHPVLIDFGPFALHTYGLFVALGCLAGMFVAQREAIRLKVDPGAVGDLCFYILIAAVLGARLFYVAVNLPVFLKDPIEVFRIWNGGLVFYGGFITAAVTALIFLKKSGLPMWKTTDILTPGVAIGHVLGRIGCFFAGCCYGKQCHLPWAVTFSDPGSLAPLGIPLHPTQLYEVVNNLIIFLFLWGFRSKKRFDGQIFWIYLLVYGLTRTLIEAFRGDPRGLFFNDTLSLSQIIGILLALIAWAMLIVKPKDKPSTIRSRSDR